MKAQYDAKHGVSKHFVFLEQSKTTERSEADIAYTRMGHGYETSVEHMHLHEIDAQRLCSIVCVSGGA